MNGQNNNNPSNQVKPDIFADRDSAAPLTRSEEHAFRAILAEEDSERLYNEHVEAAHRKMWMHFQAAASSLTQLYRDRDSTNDRQSHQTRPSNLGSTSDSRTVDRSSQDSMWIPFQTAAGNLTHLYRESLDNVLRSGGSLARKSGYQRARKELLSWARSKRRCIPRDELLAVLASMNMSASSDILSSLQQTQTTQMAVSHSQGQSLLGVEDLLQAASFNENSANHHHSHHPSMPLLGGTTSTASSIAPLSAGSVGATGIGAVTSVCGHNGHLSTGFPRQGVKRPLPPPSPPPHLSYSLEDSQNPMESQNMESPTRFSSNPVSDCFAAAASLANVTDSDVPEDASNKNENSNNRDEQMEHFFSPLLKKPRT